MESASHERGAQAHSRCDASWVQNRRRRQTDLDHVRRVQMYKAEEKCESIFSPFVMHTSLFEHGGIVVLVTWFRHCIAVTLQRAHARAIHVCTARLEATSSLLSTFPARTAISIGDLMAIVGSSHKKNCILLKNDGNPISLQERA